MRAPAPRRGRGDPDDAGGRGSKRGPVAGRRPRAVHDPEPSEPRCRAHHAEPGVAVPRAFRPPSASASRQTQRLVARYTDDREPRHRPEPPSVRGSAGGWRHADDQSAPMTGSDADRAYSDRPALAYDGKRRAERGIGSGAPGREPESGGSWQGVGSRGGARKQVGRAGSWSASTRAGRVGRGHRTGHGGYAWTAGCDADRSAALAGGGTREAHGPPARPHGDHAARR
jgi:hypothetical protein